MTFRFRLFVSVAAAPILLGLVTALFGQSAPAQAPTGSRAEEAVQLSVFTVTSNQDVGYGATHSIAGSRIDTPLREVPNYTITLNEQLLKDVGAIDMMDALPYASGVTPAAFGYADTQFSLRGYALGGTGLRDGLADTEAVADVTANDALSYDRIEVVKGPAGVLYGAMSMGGIINKVSKTPRFDRRVVSTQLTASTGWNELVRGAVDASGPLGNGGNTGYRLAASYQDGKYVWDGRNDRYSLYSVLKHRFGANRQSSVWGRFMYYRYDINRSQGVIFVDAGGRAPAFQRGSGREVANFPVSENSGSVTRSYETGAETNFAMGASKWSLRLIARHGNSGGDKDPSWAGGTPVALGANGVRLGTNLQVAADDPRVTDWRSVLTVRAFEGYVVSSNASVDLVGKFDLGPTSHQLVASANGGKSENERTFNFWTVLFPGAPAAAANTYSLINASRDLANVSYTAARASGPPTFNALSNRSKGEGRGFGAQDSVAFLDRRIIAVAGARYNWSRSTAYTLNQALNVTRTTSFVAKEWTHKYGLVVAPVKGLSVFGQESTTFSPVNTVNPATGSVFPNQIGTMRELGLKVEFLEGRLVATTSVFKSRLTNIVIQVVNPPSLGGGTFPQAAGTQIAKGWETDLAWQPMPGLTTLVAYSDVKSTNEAGRGFRGAPQSPTYSLFAKYSLQSTGWRGAGASVGYRHYGIKPVDATDTLRLAETESVNLGLYYEPQRQPWSVQLNVYNLFDADEPFTSVSTSAVQLQFPREYRLTLNYRF